MKNHKRLFLIFYFGFYLCACTNINKDKNQENNEQASNNLQDSIQFPSWEYNNDCKVEYEGKETLVGNILITTDKCNYVNAVNVIDGKAIWNYKVPGEILQMVCDNNLVYIISHQLIDMGDGMIPRMVLHALNLNNGKLKWNFNTNGDIDRIKIEYSNEGILYIATVTDNDYKNYLTVYGLSIEHGNTIWKYQAPQLYRKEFGGYQDKYLYNANRHVILLTQHQDSDNKYFNTIFGINSATGKVEWTFKQEGVGKIENTSNKYVVLSNEKGFEIINIEQVDKSLFIYIQPNFNFVTDGQTMSSIISNNEFYFEASLGQNHSDFGSGNINLFAYDLQSGDKLWQQDLSAKERHYVGSWPCPLSISGNRIFAVTPSSINCFNKTNGNKLFQLILNDPAYIYRHAISHDKLYFSTWNEDNNVYNRSNTYNINLVNGTKNKIYINSGPTPHSELFSVGTILCFRSSENKYKGFGMSGKGSESPTQAQVSEIEEEFRNEDSLQSLQISSAQTSELINDKLFQGKKKFCSEHGYTNYEVEVKGSNVKISSYPGPKNEYEANKSRLIEFIDAIVSADNRILIKYEGKQIEVYFYKGTSWFVMDNEGNREEFKECDF